MKSKPATAVRAKRSGGLAWRSRAGRHPHWQKGLQVLFLVLVVTSPVRAQSPARPSQKPPVKRSTAETTFDPGILKDLDQPSTNRQPGTPLNPKPISGDEIQCAALTYARVQKSKCFANQFLTDLAQNTNVRTQPQFIPVRLDAKELFRFPFAVLSGEGAFKLTEEERANLKQYLENGGFLLASAGCSSKPWTESFKEEMKKLLHSRTMVKLLPENPIFHTVYDVKKSHYKSGKDHFPDLFGIDVDGRVAVIFSPDGLNDTGNAGGDCCCCGGDEVEIAKQINVNVLAYALTH